MNEVRLLPIVMPHVVRGISAALALGIVLGCDGPPPPLPPRDTAGGAIEYPAEINAHGVWIAHLDGDGIPDLAVANAGSNSVSILLGRGDGTFEAARHLGTGSQPKSVTASDFDGDGRVDLVTANQGSGDVGILLGDGLGSFATVSTWRACDGAHEVGVGLFDEDALPDLAVACWADTRIAVLLGTGDGAFSSPVEYTTEAAPHSVAIADFDDDGRQDIAIANQSGNSVSVLRGGGDGTFAEPVHLAVGEGPHSIRAGDLDGDGTTDLVTANEYADAVTVLLAGPGGTFRPAADYATGRVPKGIVIADFDGDGVPDIVTANTAGRYPTGEEFPGGSQVSVLLGHGDGTFGLPTDYRAGNAPFSVAAGWLDGDDRVDLATANWFGNSVSVLLSAGPSTASSPEGVRYLSDLSWISSANGFGPLERDRRNGGAAAGDAGRIALAGTSFPKGIGAHAPAELRVAVEECTRFMVQVALDPAAGTGGSITIAVEGDGVVLYKSELLTGDAPPLPLDVPIAGMTELRLLVDDAGDGAAGDYAVLADARLECPSAP